MSGEIVLPVSLGEALDKLTILEIKQEKITDESRRTDVKREIDALLPHLAAYKEKYSYLYKILKHCNQIIWDLQDSFHGKSSPPVETCQAILRENDRRFRIKRKINDVATSLLKEQKGYAKRRVFVYTHLGLGDMIWMNGAIRYLATDYDEVAVVCKKNNEKNVRAMYSDDPSIQLVVINDDDDIYPWLIQDSSGNIARRLQIPGTEILECGLHARRPIFLLPQSFYIDLNIPVEYSSLYFHIPPSPAAIELADRFREIPYILIHEMSSQYHADIFNLVKDKGLLVLDIHKNHYEEGSPNWELAEKVLDLPLFDYIELLKGAREIHLIESSLFCLAASVDCSKAVERVCYNGYGEGAFVRTKGYFQDGKTTIRKRAPV